MKKTYSIILVVVVAVSSFYLSSCSTSNSFDPQTKQLIDSLSKEGINYIDTAKIPYGFTNSTLWGNTDFDKNGYFHRQEFKPKTMKIKGWEFEKMGEDWTSHYKYYRFDFGDKSEEKEFVEFQNFCSNFQAHGKSPVYFFKIDSVWYMKYNPMP